MGIKTVKKGINVKKLNSSCTFAQVERGETDLFAVETWRERLWS